MGATYYKVMLKEAGGTDAPWTALGVLAGGKFVQSYGRYAGLKFFDHASAEKAMLAAQNYFEYANRIGEWKVIEVHE